MRQKKSGFGWNTWLGTGWLAFLALSYFIPLEIESGENYVVRDSLLGIMIFHNIWVLGVYLVIGIVLILFGAKRFRVV